MFIFTLLVPPKLFLSSAVAIKKLRQHVDMGTAEDAIKDWLKSRKFAKNNAIPNIE